MKRAKRSICMLVCVAILLSMTGCGKTETESTAAVETISQADIYLEMAQEFVAKEQYDSALDVLNQAKQKEEDQRLDAMIAQIEEMRPVSLDVTYNVNTDKLKTEGVQIHSVSAQVQGDMVHYEVEYTAPKGMYLQVLGTDLNASMDYLTPGGKDLFVFELNKQTASEQFANLTVLLKYSYHNYLKLDITTPWPDDAQQTLVEIPVTNDHNDVCSVDRATVRAVGENLLHFHVEYTTPLEGRYYAAWSFAKNGEDTFYSVGVAPGEDMISLMMDRAEMENVDAMYVRLFEQNKWDEGLVAELRSGDYTLPQFSGAGNAQETEMDDFELFLEKAPETNFRLDNVLVNQTPAGILYTMNGDFSDCTTATAYCDIRSLSYTITMRMTNADQMQFFVPAEILNQASWLSVEFWGENGYIGYTPLAYDYTFADAVTVLHPEKTPESAAEAMTPALYTQYPSWMWENKLTHSEAEFYDLTKSMLENGNIRYELEYHATAGMNVTAADASNAELYQVTRQQPTSGRREVFAFEVDKSIADQVGDICITFTSEMDEGEFTVYTWKNEYLAMATEGNPIGEAQPVEVKTNSKKVTVHSLTAQQLDNGFVRYTVEFTTLAGRNVSFFTPPSGDIFMYFGDRTTGERDTLVVDIPQADHEAATDISMKFYDTSVNDNVFAFFKRATF